MSHSHDPAVCPAHLIHPIGLTSCPGGWIAGPACKRGRACRPFSPFRLLLPPRQRLDWLVVAGHRFWERHQRAMVALLLIDCQTRQWTIAWPFPRCSAQCARWTVPPAHPSNSAAMVCIGGTFQMIAPQAAPTDHVPAQAGLHFMLRPSIPRPLLAFVRDNTGLVGAEPYALLTDDWAETITAAMSRLRLD